jgi:hypothetical protein
MHTCHITYLSRHIQTYNIPWPCQYTHHRCAAHSYRHVSKTYTTSPPRAPPPPQQRHALKGGSPLQPNSLALTHQHRPPLTHQHRPPLPPSRCPPGGATPVEARAQQLSPGRALSGLPQRRRVVNHSLPQRCRVVNRREEQRGERRLVSSPPADRAGTHAARDTSALRERARTREERGVLARVNADTHTLHLCVHCI